MNQFKKSNITFKIKSKHKKGTITQNLLKKLNPNIRASTVTKHKLNFHLGENSE
jgi:hypothetical protein